MGYSVVALHRPKNSINVGAALRAAGCFDASLVVCAGRRYQKAPTDTMCTYRHTPLIECEDVMGLVPFDCVPVAVEVSDNAKSLHSYKHPRRAFYVFGPEDGSLPGAIMDKCGDVVRIPSGCLNLAAAVNVVLYDRRSKALAAL